MTTPTRAQSAMRAATESKSCSTESGWERGRSVPSARYARSAKISEAVEIPRARPGSDQPAAGQADQKERLRPVADGLDYRAGKAGVFFRHNVQRPVRLDVLKPEAVPGRKPCQRSNLIRHQVPHFRRRQGHSPPPKAGEVGQARMRSQRDSRRRREFHRAGHGAGVAGMKSAGDACRRRRAQQRSVIAERVRSKAFAEIGV